MKTEGLLQLRMKLLTRNLVWVLLLFIGAISLWTPLVHERVAERWFNWPNVVWFTDQGARDAKNTVKRSRAPRGALAAMSVNAREGFLTLGQ